jgi:molybdopterin/thiamine biosynthesis adenylyltransferase
MKVDLAEGRYDRQELITWWDQAALRQARVLVVGAGALGNEILKNLALVGVGTVHVIDLDHIERSNLARCVLFNESDEGRPKAEAARDSIRRLNPEVDIHALQGNVLDRGIGWVTNFDLVIAGLDNREARAWVNGACRKMSIPWIDGAIEGLRGVARVFLPDGPCYECTLGEVDRKLLALRRACSLLTPAEMAGGRVPTTATTSAIIAAVQVQEAIKLLAGRPEMLAGANSGWAFLGETLETYRVVYDEDPYCPAHDTYVDWQRIPRSEGLTLRDILSRSVDMATPDAVELEGEIVVARRCLRCGTDHEDGRWMRAVPRADAVCPTCETAYQVDFRRVLSSDDRLIDVPVDVLELPAEDVVTIRMGEQRQHYVLDPA